VVVTESDVRQYGDEPSPVICPPLKEGRELYRASSPEPAEKRALVESSPSLTIRN
jgi:hypothetical protein